MTSVVMVETENVPDLDPQKRRFVELYFNGPNAGNATKCALELHPDWNYNRASVEGSLWLKDEKVRKYLKELNRRVMEGLTEQLKPWMPLAVKAQRKLENHIDGTERLSGTDLAIIREVLDRALGKSVEKVEADIGSRLDNLIKELAAKRRNNGGQHEFRPPTTPLQLSAPVHEEGSLGDPE